LRGELKKIVPKLAKMINIDVTAMTIFERFDLVSVLAPTCDLSQLSPFTHTLTVHPPAISQFLCNLVVVFFSHDSPSNNLWRVRSGKKTAARNALI